MNRVKRLFIKAGGFSIIRNYWRAHVLFYACFQATLLGFSTKSLEILQLSVNNRIVSKFRRKYRKKIQAFKLNESVYNRNHISQQNDTIWTCWFQGLENAPEIVKKCVESVKKNIPNKNVVILDAQNYTKFVELPDYIVEKYNRGDIGQAHFSDLLRLKILIEYGGTWIDSTVLCSSPKIPSYMLDSELFLFQVLKPGLNGHPTTISNWFISAYSNNCILRLTYELLLEYWWQYDYAIDYFIFHDLFQLAIETFPEVWEKVVPVSNETPHMLLLRLGRPYEPAFYNDLISQCCFHKLTYRIPEEISQKHNTIFEHFMNG